MQISLLSIDARKNRWRTYLIEVTAPKGTEGTYAVQLSWGRICQTPKRQIKHFQEHSRMLQFLHSVVHTRLNHGYALLDKSDDVPATLLGNTYPAYRLTGRQLALF